MYWPICFWLFFFGLPRILHTIDKLGALLKIEEDQTHKRIISEGFGLEVWDIDKLASDEDTVIGIKVNQRSLTDFRIIYGDSANCLY